MSATALRWWWWPATRPAPWCCPPCASACRFRLWAWCRQSRRRRPYPRPAPLDCWPPRACAAHLSGSFAPDRRIIRVGSRELVDLAGANVRGLAPDPEALRTILKPFFTDDLQVDAIVLGCTHFPLLTEALRLAAPVPV